MLQIVCLIALISLVSNLVLVVFLRNTIDIANELFWKLNEDGGRE
jgi:hypothetical protein